jgi:hypothetical protein
MNIQDQLPMKVEKYLEHNNKILIYPNQYEQIIHSTDFEDITFGVGKKKSTVKR